MNKRTSRLPHSLLSASSIALAASPLAAQTYFSEDFESYTAGDQPSGNYVRPSTNTGTEFVQVVTGSANVAGGGTGNGLQIFDNGNGITAYANDFSSPHSSPASMY